MTTLRVLLISTICALAAAPTSAFAAAGFKITFGLKQQAHGRTWAGGLRDAAQVRRIMGWHLDTEDKILPPDRWQIALRIAGGHIAAKGIILEIVSPEEQPVPFYVRYGDFSFVPAEIPYGTVHFPAAFNGDVSIERVPLPAVVSTEEYENDDPALLRTRGGEYWMAWVGYKTKSRRGHFIEGGDRVMVARSRDGVNWSIPKPVTPPGDHFRVALGEDGQGRIWCVYGLQKQLEAGNFDLFARTFDGAWSAPQQLTSHPLPDTFHRMASDRQGNLYLVWMGFRPHSEGAPPQSDVFLRVRTEQGWGEEINVSQSADDDWEPAVAVGDDARAWIAWDSYRPSGQAPATYDVLLRDYRLQQGSGALGQLRTVSATPYAEMRAHVAVDGSQRVWLAWEEGNLNWGKDTGYENPRHRINLRKGGAEIYRPPNRLKGQYRRPRVAVLEGSALRQPAADVSSAFPSYLEARLFQNPMLGVGADGNVWVILRHQMVARGRNGGHLFDFYATTLKRQDGEESWLHPVLLPHTTGRQDTVLASAPGRGDEIVFGTVSDGRRLPVGLPEHNDVAAVTLSAEGLDRSSRALAPFEASPAGEFSITHPDEAAEVAAVRDYRVRIGGETYKIVRGDLHRHSEISMDGAIDGSIWDLYRYAVNGASFDFFAVTDHNYGAWLDTDEPETPNTDDVYQWWRTQKSADLFHVPGRFVPLYGYERSINFPLGHVNVFHPRRGVFSYRVTKLNIAERPELIEQDAYGLRKYLSATGGVGISHTSGSTMGTDWKFLDDTVVPVVEIYQGDRNAYEEEGAPRSAVPDSIGLGLSGRAPFQKGLVRNALGVGFRLGFIASSDHYSTHISYANLLVPDGVTTRRDIQEALQRRRTYASTDNIVLDFRAGETLQGGELAAAASPVFDVKVIGTEPVLRIDVIKNNRLLYTHRPTGTAEARRNVSFTFRDAADFGGDFSDTEMAPTSQISDWQQPETGIRPRPPVTESYYYVRVLQSYSAGELEREGEVAWSSPIFVRLQSGR